MPWIPEQHMADVHIIRQDHARALATFEAHPSPENEDAYIAQVDRRARAIRMIAEEDGASVRHLSAMFRTSKTVIREALADGG